MSKITIKQLLPIITFDIDDEIIISDKNDRRLNRLSYSRYDFSKIKEGIFPDSIIPYLDKTVIEYKPEPAGGSGSYDPEAPCEIPDVTYVNHYLNIDI